MTNLPRHGQTIIFTVTPTGSYTKPGQVYRVEHNGKRGHDFRFVSVEGFSTYDRPQMVARAQWQLA